MTPTAHPRATRRAFVSSTAVDLRAHRERVRDTLLSLGLFPVGMEQFGARGTGDASSVSTDMVASADVYIGIFAWRYGHVPAGSTRSVTHQEYEEATRLGLPRYVFLAASETEAPDGLGDVYPAAVRDPEHREQLLAFRAELKRAHVVATFTTPEDLAARVATALHPYLLQLREAELSGPAVPRDLPPRANEFVGRGDALATIRDQLRSGPGRGHAAAITGMAGVGKSALAAEALHLLAGDPGAFPGGVVWARCDGRTDLDGLAWVHDQLLAAWGVSLTPDDLARATTPEADLALRERALRAARQPAGAVRAAPPALVLLDGVERGLPLDRALEVLTPLGISVLLTARHEPASPQVRLVPLDVLDQESAVALFAERYADRGGAWEGNRDGAPAVAAVEALGRLPLAIELAAARAARARTGVAALAAELGEADRLGKLRDPLDRTRSVRYAFSRGLDLLTPLQRARFAALGLPDGPDWPRPLIERLLDAVRDDVLKVVPTPAGEADPAGDDLDVLAALALVNLAAPTPSGGPAPRVRLHPLLRELAREEWGAQPEEVRAACLGALLGAVDDLIWGAGRDFGAITREEDLIAGTLRRASQARLDPPRVLATVDALEPYLDSGGHWRLGVELSTLQLTAGRMAGDRAHEGKALNNLGYLAHRLGSTDEAAHYYARALAVRREIGDRAGEGETLNNLGGLARLQGHFEEAMRDYEQALALRREIGDRRGEGTTLHNLGTLAGDLGRPDDAARYYAQALVARREAGDPRGEGITLNNLGGLAEGLGRRAEAAGHYERALALLREVGDRAGEATALNNLGNLARAEGRAEEAEGFYEQALLIRREIGDRRGQSTTLNNLGVLAESRGRREEAAHAFERALDIERELGDRGGEAASLSNLGMLANARGRQDEARNLLDQALTIQREIRDRAGQGVVLNSLGALARAQGRHDEAARDFEEALAIQRETDDRAGEGITLNNLGLLAYARGRQDDAARDFERAIALLDATGASDAARTARDNLAALPSSARVGGVTHAGEAAAPPVGTPMPTVSAPAPMDGAVPTHGFAAPLEAPATRMPLTAPAPDAPPAPKPSATPEPRKRRRWWPFGR